MLTADSNGRVTGQFTIPANIPAGTKEVYFEGQGGSKARAAFVGRGTVITRVLRRIFTVRVPPPPIISDFGGVDGGVDAGDGVDPLAQTFTLSQSRHVSSVEVQFCAIGNVDNPVVLQIRGVETGLPTKEVIAEAVLPMGGVALNQWTKFTFASPVFLSAGVEYALVFMTDDPDHSLRIAEIGEFDADAQRWVAAQPYQVGVLLSSSNASTWTPHQRADLMFRLNAARFTATTRTVDAGSVAVTDCTDIIVWAGTEKPASDTNILVQITRADGTVITAEPGQPIAFDEKITETLGIAFLLSGTDVHSPVLYPLVQIIAGAQQDTGDYVSRAMPADAGSPMNVVVTFDCLLPGTSSVTVEAGQDGAWQAMTDLGATALGDGWQERNFKLENYQAADVRVRLTLSGGPDARPQIRNLRANVTADPVNIITGQ